MPTRITTDQTRTIIDDFAAEIKEKKTEGPKPSTAVIFFRNEHENNIERPVYEVPISLLRFRKDNGRIASDVMSYEQDKGPLLEEDEDAQKILGKFLLEKDPEKTEELMQSIRQMGQLQPAIITADGFLINGNRRKVALSTLYEQEKNPKWERMKVVILPGKNDPGGPPTLREIEQIENRYQLQSEGKSEYTLFDRALSIRRKISLGVPLDEQLRDDPRYSHLAQKEFDKAVENFRHDLLDPVDVIDRYLDILDRPMLYSTISSGPGDKEGRWQAFKDYSDTYRNIKDPVYRRKYNIELDESELGDLEEVAFKLIRKRQFPNIKVHKLMRDIKKYLKFETTKDELFNLLSVPFNLSDEELFDEDGKEYDERTKDLIWGNKHATKIIRVVKETNRLYDERREKVTPLLLLEEAFKKLNHSEMKPDLVPDIELSAAMQMSEKIEKRAEELRKFFYSKQKKNNRN